MRRIILTIILTAGTLGAFAQPRAAGLRLGITGFEADYQHTIQKNQFAEGGIGLDFGYNANGTPGIKATGTYNFIWARPAWTNKGTWALYAGPGASIGYVNDEVHFPVGNEIIHYKDNGFMLGLCAQAGLEYTFWFPLQLSIDLRPCFGMHVSGSHIDAAGNRHSARVGFYDNGLLGFIPHITARYIF